ncbi:MAG: hypothetical protein KIS92_18010, partial [Planctomycetota bacterium]|nr:hypothetical protein [Planctomycetota bacterium]
ATTAADERQPNARPNNANAEAAAAAEPAPDAPNNGREPQQQQPQHLRRIALPGWTNYAARATEDASLNALRAKVEAAPRAREPRNAYANALALAEKWDTLQAVCFEWMPFDPENPQVYEYLGKSAAGLKDAATALRAVSSIAEIAPNNAALLGRAGWVLLAARNLPMAEALFREALKQRQDDPNLYRGLALCLWQQEKLEDALNVYEGALKAEFNNRYGDVKRVLKEEAAYVVRAMPWKEGLAPEQDPRVVWPKKLGLDLKRADALRVTLGWETDANDVDLHVTDPKGEECFYSHAKNASGLELYSDQTQGLGPEVIRCEKALPGSYHIGVNYFSAGPMGVSRGVIVVFQPENGVVKAPVIVPFCLVPEVGEGKDMRHLYEAKF